MRPAKHTLATSALVACAIAVLAWASSVHAQDFAPNYDGPKYQLDEEGNVSKVYNLDPSGATNDYCLPDQFSGRVAKRKFDESGLIITGAVLEFDDGTRQFVNIEVDADAMDMMTTRFVAQGLQILLKEGREASLKLYRCGAAGRVLYVDAVW
ncbi:MAG: hypothetical protein WBV18_14995 [Methyloceanibacter sp.]|uniref:hypothetical protein n=1 Tax=Methyloceanibacter sp. TaxID=1965321 RepID=UPI003C6A626C